MAGRECWVRGTTRPRFRPRIRVPPSARWLVSGNFSLRFKNVGTQAHEMSLFKAPYGVPIEQAQKTNDPTGKRG